MPAISEFQRTLIAIRRWCGLILLVSVFWQGPAFAQQLAKMPAPAVDMPSSDADGLQTAVVAGGCFWGVQAVFQHVDGVQQAVSGYAGGTKATASYEIVSSGSTGHAESVLIKYDPAKISYGKILQIFFSVAHDPTQLNRQGPDVGPQYRSAIFYQNDKQKQVAEAYVAQMNTARAHGRPVVTQLNKFDAFYPAEPYHQDYAFLHPNNPYIAANDLPKVENLKKMFADVFRDKPNLVAAASN